MKIKRANQRAGGLLAALLVAAGTTVSSAQGAKLEARPLTHQDIHDYGLPEGSQASGGLHTVGLGQPVYLEALVGLDAEVTGVTWAITTQPGIDALEASPLGETVPIYEPKDREEFKIADRRMLRPTVEGQYTVTASVAAGGETTVLTMVVTAGTYMGVSTCKLCHSGGLAGVPNNWEPWSKTGHATFFTEAIDGLKSSHYNSGCIQCHVVGHDTAPLAVNGGFDDVAASLTPPWTFPEELVPGTWDAMDPKLKNLANIQCENCHGAGSQHASTALVDPDGSKDFIDVNYNSGDCAQCHSEEPYHVYPLQWENSKHAVGYVRDSTSCGACHNGPGFIDRMNGDPVREHSVGTINCSTCHDPHDATNPHQIRSVADAVLKDKSREGGATVITEGGNGKLCMQCHISRRDAVTYVETDRPGDHFGPHYGPQTDMFVGANAITYGKDIPSSSAHRGLEDTCVTCHMQGTDRNSPEHLLAGEHTWKMAWDDNGTKVDLVGACTECHGGIEDFDFKQQDYDGDGIVEGVQTEVKGLLTQVELMLPPIGVAHDEPDSHNLPISNSAGYTRKQLKAAYNYLFVVGDGSYGVHNASYTVGILKASIEDLSTDDNGDGIADWWQEAHFGKSWASNPDAAPNATPAGDGMPNWLKYTLNLDPMVAVTTLPDGWVLPGGSGVTPGEEVDSIRIYTAAEVVFPTEVGQQYQIQATSSPADGWQDVGAPIPGDGNDYSYLTSTRGEPKKFYRVVENPIAPAGQ